MAWIINNWQKIYENSRSRVIKDANWVPIPNKHDGKGYSKIALHPKRCEIFSIFILAVELASKMPKRGILADDDGDLTYADMELKTRFPKKLFEYWLPWIAEETEWISQTENNSKVTGCHQDDDGQPLGKCVGREGNRTEQKGREDSAEPQAASAPTSAPLLIFPTTGKQKSWELKVEKLKEYEDSYPHLDVLSICRSARQWTLDNPAKRKTAQGMAAFLGRWIAKDANDPKAPKRKPSAADNAEVQRREKEARDREEKQYRESQEKYAKTVEEIRSLPVSEREALEDKAKVRQAKTIGILGEEKSKEIVEAEMVGLFNESRNGKN